MSIRKRNTMTIHGPQVCPLRCSECPDREHHFSEGGIEMDDEEYPDEDTEVRVWCKHCPAWISYDDYLEAMEGWMTA
ncbi:MAG TPA: hypothetical protein VFG83_16805 [Kofleriaceae bacterium]|nr:hypothetical protein [Kofleriaceae bacterium]